MALGIPVVSTSIGIEGLPLESERDLLVADTAEDFSASVVRLLQDHELRERLSKNAMKVVKELYGWKTIALQLEVYYQDLLDT
jgi:glycosyltransferase involved in cell wall biosynthesis